MDHGGRGRGQCNHSSSARPPDRTVLRRRSSGGLIVPQWTGLWRADGVRSWGKGKRSEGSYEGAPAHPDQALAASASCFGVTSAPQFPPLSMLGAGRGHQEAVDNWVFQGHRSRTSRERWMMWRANKRKHSPGRKKAEAEKCLFPRV